mgnify:FL=1
MTKNNIRHRYPYIAICNSKRLKMNLGWVVYKFTKKGVYLNKTNRPKIYFGMSTDFIKSMANIRKWYSINLPTQLWSDKIKIRIKNKQFKSTEDLLLKLKSKILNSEI